MQGDEERYDEAAPEAENPETEDAHASGDSSTQQNAEAGSDRDTGDNPEQEGSEEQPKRKRGIERRFAELTSELRATKTALQARDAEVERIYRLLQSGQSIDQATGAKSEDGPPDRQQFDDYEDFLVAQAQYAAREAVRGEQQKMQAESAREREQRQLQEQHERWENSHESAYERYDDYGEIYEAVGTSINPEVAGAIKTADEPAEIVYWLGKNPKGLEKLKAMGGAAAIREVGRIEERINNSRQQRSNAPAPPTPVRGNAAPSNNPLDMRQNTDQWIKKRLEQRQKERVQPARRR